jgi:hypothetical protein
MRVSKEASGRSGADWNILRDALQRSAPQDEGWGIDHPAQSIRAAVSGTFRTRSR